VRALAIVAALCFGFVAIRAMRAALFVSAAGIRYRDVIRSFHINWDEVVEFVADNKRDYAGWVRVPVAILGDDRRVELHPLQPSPHVWHGKKAHSRPRLIAWSPGSMTTANATQGETPTEMTRAR
jgi:hypothetical protein